MSYESAAPILFRELKQLSLSSSSFIFFLILALERTRTSTPEATDPKSAAYTIPPLRLKKISDKILVIIIQVHQGEAQHRELS